MLKQGDLICADLFVSDAETKVASSMAGVDILYDDEHMICLNKPSGICTHPAAGLSEETLANRLKGYYIQKGLEIHIRPVSRLDRGTSGIITFAKNAFIHERLAATETVKEYLAIVHGKVTCSSIIIDAPIKRKTFIEREIALDGKQARTSVETLDTSNGYSLLKAYISKGRTHQIRLHLRHIGHPIVGDTLYSDICSENIISRQSLHSYRITFIHPLYKILTTVTAPLPADFADALSKIGLSYNP